MNTKVESMAFGRDNWVNKLDNLLSGALKEYSKHYIAIKVGYTEHNWEPEVERLCSAVANFISNAKTKTKFNKSTAMVEAINQAKFNQHLVTKARNKFEDMGYVSEVLKLHVTSEELLFEMMEKYLPKKIRLYEK